MDRRIQYGSALAAISVIFGACTTPQPEDFGYNSIPVEGTRPLLTILLDYSDVKFEADHDAAHFEELLFGPGANVAGVGGAFHQNSDGAFHFTNADIIGPLTHPDDPSTPVDESRFECASGYGTGCTATGEEKLTKALELAARAGVDFKAFDDRGNGDGTVTNDELVVLMITAGYAGDHRTTTRPVPADYTPVDGEGFIFPKHARDLPNVVPLLEWYSELRGDYYSTVDPVWVPSGPDDTRYPDYKFIDTLGFVPTGAFPGAAPLKVWWSPSRGDNYLTSRPEWVTTPEQTWLPDYQTVDGVTGYVSRTPDALPSSIRLSSSWSSTGRVGGGGTRPTSPAVLALRGVKVQLDVPGVGELTDRATIAHELTHALGAWEDPYGSQCNNQHYTLMSCTGHPNFSDLDPWTRMRFGWVEPELVPIGKERTVVLTAGRPSGPSKAVALLYDPSRGNQEFFLLEHRYDGGALNYDGDPWMLGGHPGVPDHHGLGIWRIFIDPDTKVLRTIPAQSSAPSPGTELNSWYNTTAEAHITSADPSWAWTGGGAIEGYRHSRVEGYIKGVDDEPEADETALQLWRSRSTGKFRLTSDPEWQSRPERPSDADYELVRHEGWVKRIGSLSEAALTNMVPLTTWISESREDYYTTTVWQASDAEEQGYEWVGIEGWVDPPPNGEDWGLYLIPPPPGTPGQPVSGNGLWERADGTARSTWLDGSDAGFAARVMSGSTGQPGLLVSIDN